jgi:hypothetical protein
MRATLFGAAKLLLTVGLLLATTSAPVFGKEGSPELKIVKDTLLESGNFYFVRGVVYNPNSRAVKNVVIRYFIWKKWMGRDGHGSVIKDTGGLVRATIKYIPPKQSVDFATDSGNAPVMTVESGLVPDPLDAEITAEWDK